MFFFTFSTIWSISYFFYVSYTLLVTAIIVYVNSQLSTNLTFSENKLRINLNITNGYDVIYTITLTYITFICVTTSWISPTFSVWFGHLIITPLQLKMSLLVILMYIITSSSFFSNIYFSSREVYDYIIVTMFFSYWILFLFYTNSFFSTIFFIEVLSSLLFLLIITSTFSSAFFYRNTEFSSFNFLQNSLPSTFIQSLIIFFWVSLLASLNLFLFTIIFFTKIFSFDYFLLEYLFLFFINSSSYKDIVAFAVTWFILVVSIFVKCGIAPMFLWKPTFFKGLPIYTISFYVLFFYFFTFLFFILLFTNYVHEIFYFYTLVSIFSITIGLITLFSILCESFFIKSFIALSSILNSILVLLAMISENVVGYTFWF